MNKSVNHILITALVMIICNTFSKYFGLFLKRKSPIFNRINKDLLDLVLFMFSGGTLFLSYTLWIK